MREHIISAGFTESRFSPATFELHDDQGRLVGLLNVHVDDGLWAGAGEVYERARTRLRELIHIGKEQRGSFEFLGRHVTQEDDGTIKIDQNEYVRKIQPIYIPAVRRQIPVSYTHLTLPTNREV